MHKSFALGACIVVSSLLIGCSLFFSSPDEQPPSRDDVVFRTDRTAYVVHEEHAGSDFSPSQFRFELVATFENRSRRTIYLSRCYPDSPQPRYGVGLLSPEDGGASAYSPVWACVGHENPIPVPAGATRVDTLQVDGPNSWRHGTREHFGVLEGAFFLSYRAQICRAETGCELPDSLSRSNSFEVQLAR